MITNDPDYFAQLAWLRAHPQHERAGVTQKALWRYEDKARREGRKLHSPARSPLAPKGWVTYWPDRPGQPTRCNRIHAERDCPHIDGYPTREATLEDRETRDPCSTCS